MPTSPRLCLIYGSARPGRFCDTVGGWVQSELARHGYFSVDVVDPLVHQTPAARSPRLGAADAFIAVTPEYNHSFPAPLKEIIDGAQAEWEAKPVAFVSYGSGMSGGQRAVEQLRGVFASLHAVSVREQVVIAKVFSAFDDLGMPSDGHGLHRAFTRMVNRMVWWSDALSQARAKHPYREAA